MEKNPSALLDKLESNIIYVRRLKNLHQYFPSFIMATDKTPVWEDMITDTTVECLGKKDILMKTTGHE